MSRVRLKPTRVARTTIKIHFSFAKIFSSRESRSNFSRQSRFYAIDSEKIISSTLRMASAQRGTVQIPKTILVTFSRAALTIDLTPDLIHSDLRALCYNRSKSCFPGRIFENSSASLINRAPPSPRLRRTRRARPDFARPTSRTNPVPGRAKA
jgi:hypothetical protein